jgi:hypothetical protein
MVTLQENGRYGVGFFFVISGFLICTLFLREEAANGRIQLWKFYGRRALRLLPLYYAALLAQIILVFFLHQYSPENQQLFRDKLPSYLFYYSNWLSTSTAGPFFCAWSLAVEEQFYIVFGLLLSLANRRIAITAVALAFLVKLVVYQWFGPVDATSALCRVLVSYREPILLGVAGGVCGESAGWLRAVPALAWPALGRRERWGGDRFLAVFQFDAPRKLVGRAAAVWVDDADLDRAEPAGENAGAGQRFAGACREGQLWHLPAPHVRDQRGEETAGRRFSRARFPDEFTGGYRAGLPGVSVF